MSASTPRFYARRATIQVLYQESVNEQEVAQNGLNFVLAENPDEIDQKYFEILVEGIFKKITIQNLSRPKAPEPNKPIAAYPIR